MILAYALAAEFVSEIEAGQALEAEAQKEAPAEVQESLSVAESVAPVSQIACKGRSHQPRRSELLTGAAASGAASLRDEAGRSRALKFILDCDSFATFEAL